MNEQLQNELVKIIKSATEAAGTATDFMAAELPLVAQEVLRYNFAFSLTIFVVGLILCAVACVILYKAHKANPDGEDPFFYFCVGAAAVSLVGIVVIGENLDWLKIWLAPKLYLIEYVGDLAK